MGFIEELMKEAVAEALECQDKIPHEHLWELKMYSAKEPLRCKSEYFVQMNEYTLGLDREDLIKFREEFNKGVDIMLEGHKPAMTSTPCLICSRDTTTENAFQTSLGWMHFECEEVR